MSRTILVVDDEEEILELCRKKLVEAGFQTITAGRGEEAVTKAKNNVPDLILMDIILPDIDGPEVVQRLKEEGRTQNIPVIFLSGILAPGDCPTDGIKVGGDFYEVVTKPIRFSQLLENIKRKLNP